jgi:hypothetical protein
LRIADLTSVTISSNPQSAIRNPQSNHSLLSVAIGSTFVALRAGIEQASSATKLSNSVIAANVSGSVALTPKSNPFIIRANSQAEGDHRNQRKAGILQQRSRAVAQVLPERSHKSSVC